MKSWRTTAAGIALAVGMALVAVSERYPQTPGWLAMIGFWLTVLAPLLLGAAARDNGVTSKEAGAE